MEATHDFRRDLALRTMICTYCGLEVTDTDWLTLREVQHHARRIASEPCPGRVAPEPPFRPELENSLVELEVVRP